MSEAATRVEAPPLVTSLRADLRSRIAWICHAIRIAAVLWFGWEVVWTFVSWSDKARILQIYGFLFSSDFSGVSDARYAAAVVAVVLSVAAGVPVVICLWRLAGTYLAGRVFTVDAALWLRRTGIAGLVAIFVSLVARAVVASIMVGQPLLLLPRGSFVLPQDLLHSIFAIFVLALAHIFKAAAEMAEDHAQIV